MLYYSVSDQVSSRRFLKNKKTRVSFRRSEKGPEKVSESSDGDEIDSLNLVTETGVRWSS